MCVGVGAGLRFAGKQPLGAEAVGVHLLSCFCAQMLRFPSCPRFPVPLRSFPSRNCLKGLSLVQIGTTIPSTQAIWETCRTEPTFTTRVDAGPPDSLDLSLSRWGCFLHFTCPGHWGFPFLSPSKGGFQEKMYISHLHASVNELQPTLPVSHSVCVNQGLLFPVLGT